MSKKGLTPVYRAMLLLFTLFLASCAGQTTQNQPEPVSDPQLGDAYLRMLVLPVGIGEKFAMDYPQAVIDCRIGLIDGLSATKRFQVDPINILPAQPTGPHTLVVKLEITDMRVASHAARMFGGAMVGSSYVNLKMTLTDGHTGRVIRDKEFSTHNNAFAAAWTSGSTDDSIPKDMGKITGDYITAVVPPTL